MPSIISDEINDHDVRHVLDEMRERLSKSFGITLVGNRCTLRWTVLNELVDVHMIISSVTTIPESQKRLVEENRLMKLFEKYPDLESELYYAEHGEHLK